MQSLVQLVKAGAASDGAQEDPHACKACQEARQHGTSQPSTCRRCLQVKLGAGRPKRQRGEGTHPCSEGVKSQDGAKGSGEATTKRVSSQRITRAQQAQALEAEAKVVLMDAGGKQDMKRPADHVEVARPLFGCDDDGLQLAYATSALTIANLTESHRIDIQKVIQFRGGLQMHFEFCGVQFSGPEFIAAMESCIAKHEEQRQGQCVDSFQSVPPSSLSPCCEAERLDVAAQTTWVCGLLSGPPGSLQVYISASVHRGAERQMWCNGPMSRLVATSAELCQATLEYRTSFTHIIARILCPSSRERLYVRLIESMFESHVREKTAVVKLKCRGGRLLRCLASIRTTMHPKPGNMKMALRFIPFDDLVSFGHQWTDVPPDGCWEEDNDDMEEGQEEGERAEWRGMQSTNAMASAISGWSFINDGKETNPDLTWPAVRETLGKLGRSYAWGAAHLCSAKEKGTEEQTKEQAPQSSEQWTPTVHEATAPSGGNGVKDEKEACDASVSDVSTCHSDGELEEMGVAHHGAHEPYGGMYESFRGDDDLMHVLDTLGPLF